MTVASVFGELILGWLIADLLTGVFHWWEDRVGKESWPLIGKWIIAPNRLHHEQPLAFTHKSFIQRNWSSAVAAITVGLIWWSFFGFSIMLATAVIGGSFANEIHRFAHEPSKCSTPVKVLQDMGLLQSSKQHARHHRPPQDANYFVLTDWLNPIFETIGFWTKLEKMLGMK